MMLTLNTNALIMAVVMMMIVIMNLIKKLNPFAMKGFT